MTGPADGKTSLRSQNPETPARCRFSGSRARLCPREARRLGAGAGRRRRGPPGPGESFRLSRRRHHHAQRRQQGRRLYLRPPHRQDARRLRGAALPQRRRPEISIPYSEIAALAFTGRDTAAGKSFEAWVQKYWEKKAAGEKEYRHSGGNAGVELVFHAQLSTVALGWPSTAEQAG